MSPSSARLRSASGAPRSFHAGDHALEPAQDMSQSDPWRKPVGRSEAQFAALRNDFAALPRAMTGIGRATLPGPRAPPFLEKRQRPNLDALARTRVRRRGRVLEGRVGGPAGAAIGE